MSHPQQRQRLARARWNPNMAKQTLMAAMPSRADPQNQAVLDNIDQHPSLAMLSPDESSDFIGFRNSTQLKAGPKAQEMMNSDYTGDFDRFAFNGRQITRCALPVTFVGEEGGRDRYSPDIDRIQSSKKELKTWRALGVHSSVIRAIENAGYDHPLPMERMAITAVQEKVSAIISGSSGCAKTTAALIASVDLVVKYLHKTIRLNSQGIHEVCAPIVVMIVPTHDLAESAYADIKTFIAQSKSDLENYVKPLVVHGSIPRFDQLALIQRNKDANILIATPGRLADMAYNNIVSSHNTQLLVVDQAFTLAGGSFQNDMSFIKSWLQGPPAAEGQFVRKPYTTLSTTGKGPHVGTNIVYRPAPEGFLGDLELPRPRRAIPSIILAQVIDLTSERDAELLKHYQKKVIMTPSYMTIRLQHNALHHFNGSIEVTEVWRSVQSRSEQLIKDFTEMSGAENKKVLAVSFDRVKVQEYDGSIRKAHGQCEMLISRDPARLWSRDAFAASDLPLLLTTTLGAEGNNWRELDNLIIIDAPSEKLIAYEGEGNEVNSFKSAFHYYVEAVGRVGRLGRSGRVKIYFDPRTEGYASEDLVKLLKMTNSPIPDFVDPTYFEPGRYGGQSDAPQDVASADVGDWDAPAGADWGAPAGAAWGEPADAAWGASIASTATEANNNADTGPSSSDEPTTSAVAASEADDNVDAGPPSRDGQLKELNTAHTGPSSSDEPTTSAVAASEADGNVDTGPISAQKPQKHVAFVGASGPSSPVQQLEKPDDSALDSSAEARIKKSASSAGTLSMTNPGGIILQRGGGKYKAENVSLLMTRGKKSAAELRELTTGILNERGFERE